MKTYRMYKCGKFKDQCQIFRGAVEPGFYSAEMWMDSRHTLRVHPLSELESCGHFA
jgi:hypothetical protein